jgi:hypothetical protein
MNEFIELTEEKWFDTFKPIPNHIDDNASFSNGEQGYMFETYGAELEFVKSQEPNRIWTYGEGDGGSYIWSGYHFVNRLGYFVSTVPFDETKDYQIQISSEDIYVCPNCDEEWEDESAALHYDKFEDLEKCAACATVEELKELEEMETQDLGKMGN